MSPLSPVKVTSTLPRVKLLTTPPFVQLLSAFNSATVLVTVTGSVELLEEALTVNATDFVSEPHEAVKV